MLNENSQRNINLNKVQILFPAVSLLSATIKEDILSHLSSTKILSFMGIADTTGTELTV